MQSWLGSVFLSGLRLSVSVGVTVVFKDTVEAKTMVMIRVRIGIRS